MSLLCAKPFPEQLSCGRGALCTCTRKRCLEGEGNASFSPQLGSSRAFPCGEETVSPLSGGELYRGNEMMISPPW